MYCYTYVNEFTCVFNELQLWTHISSEHPKFFKTVAALSNLNLPRPVQEKLNASNKMFTELYNKVVYLKRMINGNPRLYRQNIVAVRRLIDEFILHDNHVLEFYPQLLRYGVNNSAWEELVKHIINEQTFMLELFKQMRPQIK